MNEICLFFVLTWKVDDGEPLRKAALSCIDTILDNLPNRLDVGTLMPYLAKVCLTLTLRLRRCKEAVWWK